MESKAPVDIKCFVCLGECHCHAKSVNDNNAEWRKWIDEADIEDVLKKTVLFEYDTIGTISTPSVKEPVRLCDFKIKEKHIKVLAEAVKQYLKGE